MELVATLLTLALNECCERGVIDWTPDDGMPASFQADAEIERNPWTGDFMVIVFDVLTLISPDFVVWHSSKMPTAALA